MGVRALSRLAQAVPLLFLVSVAAFGIMHLAPGGPTTAYAHDPLVAGERIAMVRRSMGLDDPLPVQYLRWLRGLVTGDWGYSFATGRPVLTSVLERVPATFALMAAAFTIGIGVAVPLGMVAATHQHSRLDHAITVTSLFAWAMPVFWFALMGQLVLAVHLRLVPVAGMHATDADDFLDFARHLLLPAAVLGLTSTAGWSRYLRSSLLEALGEPYVTTGRAKGGGSRHVLWRHALPNAMLPMVTLIGLDIPQFFTGSVVIETIFAWPGMGRLFTDSLVARDYPVEMGILMIAAGLIILGNLAADLVHSALDPRVRRAAKVWA
jgi:peptide/nickel transport system permease protein